MKCPRLLLHGCDFAEWRVVSSEADHATDARCSLLLGQCAVCQPRRCRNAPCRDGEAGRHFWQCKGRHLVLEMIAPTY
jgi:hypothetical protein